MYKGIKRMVSDNMYLFLGILIGLYISSFLSSSLDLSCTILNHDHLKVSNKTAREIIDNSVNRLAPKVVTKNPDNDVKKSKLVRPRYYSTELGIREKMFVGIFTSEEKVNTQAIHINKTIGHIVDKIKFFITAQYKLKTKFNLTGLVGFTDARSKYRPFQVIKYVGDTFAQDYDYYFLANDHTFVNIHRLKDIVAKISVSMDVYMGTRVPDGSYCSLDAGIVISNSVLKMMRTHLEWCIINAVSDDHSENLGRCVHHSLGLTCQEKVQGQTVPSFRLKHFNLQEHLLDLSRNTEFKEAATIYPVLEKNDFYMLNAYFLKQRLSVLNEQIGLLSKTLTGFWPPGQRSGAKPATRFDLPRQYYFNMTHIFFPDDFTVIRAHNEPELLDIENIIENVISQVLNGNSKDLDFKRLINGYKTFDLSRGMDYILDIAFRDRNSGKEIVKRFEVCKPLGNVEFIPAPYVTENSRVTILLPIQETGIELALNFLSTYSSLIMDKKEKTFLMLVFMYQYGSSSKGLDDVYLKIKDFATKTTAKYKTEDIKIGWVSIRLPDAAGGVFLENHGALNFALIDLALKKIGLDSLVLILDVYSNVTIDFLNRVRMNTIENYQIFSPIPFRQYNPKVSLTVNMDVSKNSGHFDREEYKYISFYGRDYVAARKKYQHLVPLIRVDNDIANVLGDNFKDVGNILEMFLRYGRKLHCMRATEMNLKVLYHEEQNPKRANKFLGNEAQLARTLLTKADLIQELM
ncbi:chondroitin sulfate glucuronyltransferase [Cylas formicarius]|uniref:chondroitin sulfate glucuronyltransferase n=1 Tax=Cylas formicarius TaxID=197179 RepID=UPI0029587218|nr:chondroitin sulfate glucuronyltransferase [Cylas formicarius]